MCQSIKYTSCFYKKLFALIFHISLIVSLLQAQNGIIKCFEPTNYFNPTLQEDLEIFTKEYIAAYPKIAKNRGKITIPVVVHIVTQESGEAVSDEQIHTQITALNRDYNLANNDLSIVHPDFQNRIANVGFNFCLATTSPDGQPTTGITRRNTSDRNIAAPDESWLYHTAEGGQDAWDTKKYLNIWVTQITLDAAGFATNPGEKSPEEDGVVINPRFFGMGGLATPPFHLGRTGVHEVGHYFNLKHPWNNGCTGTDFVNDMPQQLNPYSGCPTGDNFSCDKRSITTNFMNYSDDACLAMFTKGQAMRMHAALIYARSGLLNGSSCEPYLPTVSVDEIKVYPNPASYYYCIEVGSSSLVQIPYFIYDSRGAKVEEGLVLPNSLQHFPTYRNGVYFIQFLNGAEEVIVKKIVITN